MRRRIETGRRRTRTRRRLECRTGRCKLGLTRRGLPDLILAGGFGLGLSRDGLRRLGLLFSRRLLRSGVGFTLARRLLLGLKGGLGLSLTRSLPCLILADGFGLDLACDGLRPLGLTFGRGLLNPGDGFAPARRLSSLRRRRGWWLESGWDIGASHGRRPIGFLLQGRKR